MLVEAIKELKLGLNRTLDKIETWIEVDVMLELGLKLGLRSTLRSRSGQD